MAMKLEQTRGSLKQEEVDFFLKGSVGLSKSERVSPAKWITAQVSSQINYVILCMLTEGKGLAFSRIVFLRAVLILSCNIGVPNRSF
jgi:hypothetical protein